MASLQAVVRPIRPRTVAELVTAEVRRSILSGSLPPGRTFSLREIASMFDVSFIPVRDALNTLKAEGLVITRPGRGATVAPLNLEDLHTIYRIRRLLEPDLARRSCLTMSNDDLELLELEAMNLGDETQSLDDTSDAHHAFHMALCAPVATGWDVRLLTPLRRAGERYVRVGFKGLGLSPGESTHRQHAHVNLVQQFRQRDPQVAAIAVDDHLAQDEQVAIASLKAFAAATNSVKPPAES